MVTPTHDDLGVAGWALDRGGRGGVGEVLGDQLHEFIVIHADADDAHVGRHEVLLPIPGEDGVVPAPHLHQALSHVRVLITQRVAVGRLHSVHGSVEVLQ